MTLDLAEVTFTPAWWQRLLLRAQTEHRFAARTTTGRWIWDDTTKPILDPVIEDALNRALADALRIARSSSGVEPPT